MKILLVGENFRGAPLESIYNNLVRLGIGTEMINTHDFYKISFINRVLNKFLKTPHFFGFGVRKINKIVLEKASTGQFNFILFMKPTLIYPKTIIEIKRYSKVVCLSMDHIGYLKVNSDYFYSSLPLFDSCLLNSDTDDIKRAIDEFGAKKVFFLPFTADIFCHYPVPVSFADKQRLGANVVFLGTYANERRAEYLEKLCREGYDVKIYGNSWNKLPRNSCLRKKNRIISGNTPCEEMAKIIRASKIIIAFMREEINESIACRTFEIPLCGGFMLHQRTKEVEDFLIPDKEAVLFDSYEEMKEKIDFYLAHPELREKIAKAGRERILNCGQLNSDQVKKMIELLEQKMP